ncbi:ArsR/SmtB family transcription factor [Intrasporangium calvum]|jgi:ArsR family transcriptional regulator|uniref:Transcriptional regulator, ArsR family n=1 Tax=Intrasporangium calvum (strain ATCC 23552 / DSM 43043 / JCM 3097 / NBRC 12989 / NCIMB 10167 / NRRL B-3866 / 7 KIP) TaxID=710696 RepID=E6SA77_INTC7|nr:metalloregulator ArsR/SmtB family transcription factor [Intrasporangium calvum]ADU49325.1 transcriptional regulator, ArsR family [Intrasporangium calvum DSM 43043]AXG14241.1 ArsR family transcriptional regulator [Intrasporangium calvum]
MQAEVARQLQELHARVCKAIADPKRLLIINELRDRELSVGDLSEALNLNQSNTSQHLAVLRERGIVTSHRVGTNVYYALRSQKVIQAVDLLREFLVEDLAEQGRLSGATSH